MRPLIHIFNPTNQDLHQRKQRTARAAPRPPPSSARHLYPTIVNILALLAIVLRAVETTIPENSTGAAAASDLAHSYKKTLVP
jgi:hypothetical protein